MVDRERIEQLRRHSVHYGDEVEALFAYIDELEARMAVVADQATTEPAVSIEAVAAFLADQRRYPHPSTVERVEEIRGRCRHYHDDHPDFTQPPVLWGMISDLLGYIAELEAPEGPAVSPEAVAAFLADQRRYPHPSTVERDQGPEWGEPAEEWEPRVGEWTWFIPSRNRWISPPAAGVATIEALPNAEGQYLINIRGKQNYWAYRSELHPPREEPATTPTDPRVEAYQCYGQVIPGYCTCDSDEDEPCDWCRRKSEASARRAAVKAGWASEEAPGGTLDRVQVALAYIDRLQANEKVIHQRISATLEKVAAGTQRADALEQRAVNAESRLEKADERLELLSSWTGGAVADLRLKQIALEARLADLESMRPPVMGPVTTGRLVEQRE